MLVNDGISLTKLWFSVTPVRAAHPVHHPPGRPGPAVEALADGSGVAGQVGRLHRGQGGHVRAGPTPTIAPWTVVKSNDKKRARINAMRHVLGKFDYDNKDHEVVGDADPLIVGRALRLTDARRARRARRTRAVSATALLLWLVTTAALAVAVPAAWAQQNVVDEDGYAALAASAAERPRAAGRRWPPS